VLFGRVMTSGVDTDYLAVDGELDRAGDQGNLDLSSGKGAPGPVHGASEADRAAPIGQAADTRPRGRTPRPSDDPLPPGKALGGRPALGVSGDEHAGVEDVDQATSTEHFDRLAHKRDADVVALAGHRDLAAPVDPAVRPCRPGEH